jgi:alkylation response protein AidB-like acyl-CoA dehydrogenase
MNGNQLISQLRLSLSQVMPLPGRGQTAARHHLLMEIGRRDLSLARLAEAHWDAVAILADAGRAPEPNAVYGVWASEIPGNGLELSQSADGFRMSGTKMFCSGAALVDHALVTVAKPEQRLVDVDLRAHNETICFDESGWKTQAFSETRTATVEFRETRLSPGDIVGLPGFYLDRPGFWHGACGPAACWAGGSAGLVDFARRQARSDPHTMAHLAAMQSSVWALQAFLATAGQEIDRDPDDRARAQIRALTVRHLVEQACSEILMRFARAYGPYPLAMNEDVARRRQELDLYLRQSHGERDLETMGRLGRQS